MTIYTATEFDIRNEDAGNPVELKFRKLDQNLLATAEISFGDDQSTYLSFRSVVDSVMTSHMLIDASGNVGIGSASAGEKLEVNGTIKATAFNGDGLNLTNLDGSQIGTGTIADARLPLSISRTADVDARFDPLTGHDHDGVDSKKIAALSTTYFDSLDGSGLTNLNGSQITTGTIAAARIDTAILTTSNLAVPNGIATLDADTRLVQTANTVWDGSAGRSANTIPAPNTIPVRDSLGYVPKVKLFDRYFSSVDWQSFDGWTITKGTGAATLVLSGGQGIYLDLSSDSKCFINSNMSNYYSSWSRFMSTGKIFRIMFSYKEISMLGQNNTLYLGLSSSLTWTPPLATTAQLMFRIVGTGTQIDHIPWSRTSNGTNYTDASGSAISHSAPHYFLIEFVPGTSATFYIDGTLFATHTTNLPSISSYNLFPMIGIYKGGSTSTSFTIGNISIEAEFV